MIRYIKGKVAGTFEGGIVLENGGIGYEIFMPDSSAAFLASPDAPVTIHTYMAVREDAVSLYGFDDRESLELFRMLITVSGIGNKAALAILSALSPQEVKRAVLFDDTGALTRAQGVGKKSASRIILELKDKIKDSDIGMSAAGPSAGGIPSGTAGAFEDAVSALMALGYTRGEAADAAAPAAEENATAEEIIKAALRNLARL